MPATPLVSVDGVRAHLDGSMPWQITVVAATGSTNADLARQAGQLEPGSVLVANHQESGRGRFERSWQDVPGTAVATSVLLAPKRDGWGWLSMLVGMAIHAGISELAPASGRVSLKWPNDVLIDGRKVCGILCERRGDWAICGWGINVSMDESELPVPSATSLLLAGLPTDKDRLLAGVLNQLGRLFTDWNSGSDLSGKYAQLCDSIGRDVRILLDANEPAGNFFEGRAVGIDDDGCLIVAGPNTRRSFAAGDVIHLR